jgi:hypothetical protein
MRSERQIHASQLNGAKSRGPVSIEGKLASSRNSIRHGLLSQTMLLAGESSENFAELLAGFKAEHQPETSTENALVETMAAASWRQIRIRNIEAAGLDLEIDATPDVTTPSDFHTQAFTVFRKLTDETGALELLNRYESRYDRQFRTALATRAAEIDQPLPRVSLAWVSPDGTRQIVAGPGSPSYKDGYTGDYKQTTCDTKIDLPNEPTGPIAPPTEKIHQNWFRRFRMTALGLILALAAASSPDLSGKSHSDQNLPRSVDHALRSQAFGIYFQKIRHDPSEQLLKPFRQLLNPSRQLLNKEQSK